MCIEIYRLVCFIPLRLSLAKILISIWRQSGFRGRETWNWNLVSIVYNYAQINNRRYSTVDHRCDKRTELSDRFADLVPVRIIKFSVYTLWNWGHIDHVNSVLRDRLSTTVYGIRIARHAACVRLRSTIPDRLKKYRIVILMTDGVGSRALWRNSVAGVRHNLRANSV